MELPHELAYSVAQQVRDYEVTYVAGGASQNAARGAAVSAKKSADAFCITDPNEISMSFQQDLLSSLVPLVTTTLPSNLNKPTNARDLTRYTKSRRAKRLERAASFLQATTGTCSCSRARQ